MNFFFLKNEINDSFFGAQGIFHYKLKLNNPLNSVINQWTNWLKDHYYQYDLSKSRWSKLVPQKWRNRIIEYRIAQNLLSQHSLGQGKPARYAATKQ